MVSQASFPPNLSCLPFFTSTSSFLWRVLKGIIHYKVIYWSTDAPICDTSSASLRHSSLLSLPCRHRISPPHLFLFPSGFINLRDIHSLIHLPSPLLLHLLQRLRYSGKNLKLFFHCPTCGMDSPLRNRSIRADNVSATAWGRSLCCTITRRVATRLSLVSKPAMTALSLSSFVVISIFRLSRFSSFSGFSKSVSEF